jgi:pimeloyl-ACP methyl ester carboxylesterase
VSVAADRSDRSPALPYLLAEVRAAFEVAALVPSLPMLLNAPKGDGHHVMVIPPFGAGDAFTKVLRSYLARLGYGVHRWGNPEILALHRLQTVALKRLDDVAGRAGGPLTLIGHSLGGIYAREVARAAPDHIRQVITVGSPFAGDLKANVVWPLYEAVTGTRIASIPPEVMARLNEPLPMPTTAIYSRTDGVVSWRSCIDEASGANENIEVAGSHVGLLHNPAALYVIADRLAQPPGVPERFDPSGWRRLLARHGPYRNDVG